jgi:hypothetical protein
MKKGKQSLGALWYLGTSQYCICLFGGGALWFLVAQLSGFFWGNLAAQVGASLLLLLVIVLESWWAHIPSFGNQVGDYIGDFLTSAAIAGFGMGVVVAIFAWLPR